MFHKICVYLALCASLLQCGIAAVDDDSPEEGGLDFDTPTAAINGAKEGSSFDYQDFCKETADKVQMLGCQLKAPNEQFELRVCKLETGCAGLVTSRIESHDALREGEEKVTVIRYTKKNITGLKCKDEADKNTCIGYLEEWIPETQAHLRNINEKIFDEDEDELIAEIKSYQTTPDAKRATAADLQKIVDFMRPPNGQCTLYQQLCNLEGFFKQSGGFVVHNPVVKYKMMPEDVCDSGGKDPTNLRVVAVLKKFIEELNASASKSS